MEFVVVFRSFHHRLVIPPCGKCRASLAHHNGRKVESCSSVSVRILLLSWVAGLFLAYSACARQGPGAAAETNGQGSLSATARVERRDFRRTLRLHGTVEASQSYVVMAPRLTGQASSSMVITKLVGNGQRVRAGDTLLEFDRQNQMRTVFDREAEYQNLLEQIKRKQADQAVGLARDETELKSADYDLQSARVDMRKNEVISSIEAERNKQNLAEAEARLKQLKETFNLKREAAAAELRILEIQRDRAQNAMLYARRNIEKMTIKSPLEGLAVLTPIFKMSRMAAPQEGDEVRPGSALLLVVNPSAMQVRARVNQVDIYSLHLDQAAEVRLDAYPEMVLPGRVERIGAMAGTSDYSKVVRSFAVQIAITGSDPKLLPDLSAAVDVLLESRDNVLLLPREAILMQQGQPFVEVLADGRAELRAVSLGPANECEVVITSGIEEGTTVSRMPRPLNAVARRLPE